MYFDIFKTTDEVKKRYRLLSKLFHPDHGGPVELMQELNFYYAKKNEEMESEKEEENVEVDIEPDDEDEYLEKIEKIMRYAEKNKKFDTSFVESVYLNWKAEGVITARQKVSIDKIFFGFRVEESLKN